MPSSADGARARPLHRAVRALIPTALDVLGDLGVLAVRQRVHRI
ncbi:hypothetical protein [Oerskovia sp. Root918]|nr:hypothetical protein [Oerskovia sp. Root918]